MSTDADKLTVTIAQLKQNNRMLAAQMKHVNARNDTLMRQEVDTRFKLDQSNQTLKGTADALTLTAIEVETLRNELAASLRYVAYLEKR
jgi:hypothetical protein